MLLFDDRLPGLCIKVLDNITLPGNLAYFLSGLHGHAMKCCTV